MLSCSWVDGWIGIQQHAQPSQARPSVRPSHRDEEGECAHTRVHIQLIKTGGSGRNERESRSSRQQASLVWPKKKKDEERKKGMQADKLRSGRLVFFLPSSLGTWHPFLLISFFVPSR